MDRACFRKSREPVSGGAEGLVLGVVCVFFFLGGGESAVDPWKFGSLSGKNKPGMGVPDTNK